MKDSELNKLKDLAIKAAAGSFPLPVPYEQPRIYSDAEISYLAFAAAVTPAAFLAIVNDFQAEVAAKQQNVDYLADRLPETQHNAMMQLSHQLEEAQALLRHTQDKLGKSLVRNSEYAGELSRRDAAAGEHVAWQFFDNGQWYTGSDRNNHRKNTESAGYRVRNLYAAAQPAALPSPLHLDPRDNAMRHSYVAGYDKCLADAKALDCQPVSVVKLPQQKTGSDVSYGGAGAFNAGKSVGFNEAISICETALDTAGIKWEVSN